MSNLADFILEQRSEVQKKIIAKAWEDEAFKQELLSNPKAVLQRELNINLPDSISVNILEETADTSYLVLPQKPSDQLAADIGDIEVTEVGAEGELSDEELEAVAGGGFVSSLVTSFDMSAKTSLTSVMFGYDKLGQSLGQRGMQRYGLM